jgi:adenylate cyclase
MVVVMQLKHALRTNKAPLLYLLCADVLEQEKISCVVDNASLGDPIRRRINRLERAAESCFGKIIRRTSHSLQATFDKAESAVRAACEMQKHCALIPQLSIAKLGVQIGIDISSSEQIAVDNTHNQETNACRLANLLGDGGIVVANTIVQELPHEMREKVYTISAANSRQAVHAVHWQDGHPVYPSVPVYSPEPLVSPKQSAPTILLRLAGVSYRFEVNQTEINIGRDLNSDIVVKHNKASRNHCKLVVQNNGCTLIDNSANGTYITSSDGMALKVSHDSTRIKDRGWITLGHLYHQNSQFRIEFEVFPF